MLAIAILAAGKGSRMKSETPKVLHKLGGKTLIERVVDSCNDLNPSHFFVVIGYKGDQIREQLNSRKDIQFVEQQPQNGTGHAVQKIAKYLRDFDGELIVLNSDVPLLKNKTLDLLIKKHRETNADVTLLSAEVSKPYGYGRIFADINNKIDFIKEEKDCSIEQKKNKLINSGIYCFNWIKLFEVLHDLSSNNKQNEIYLTDTIAKLSKSMHLKVDDNNEISGINNMVQLASCESMVQEHLRNRWMKEGVLFIEPNSSTISEDCIIGQDVIIEPQTHIRGKCIIGSKCNIGPNVLINNSIVGDNVKIIYSVLNNVTIGNNCEIGPFANLRPESIIKSKCKIGNFVEIKKSTVEKETKINHLSYIGDSFIGKNVNIGAGTITANFDGEKKNITIIHDNTKTGANSVLVAPITLGLNVVVGAGSTLTKDVPNYSLAIERSKQLIKENWSKPRDD